MSLYFILLSYRRSFYNGDMDVAMLNKEREQNKALFCLQRKNAVEQKMVEKSEASPAQIYLNFSCKV